MSFNRQPTQTDFISYADHQYLLQQALQERLRADERLIIEIEDEADQIIKAQLKRMIKLNANNQVLIGQNAELSSQLTQQQTALTAANASIEQLRTKLSIVQAIPPQAEQSAPLSRAASRYGYVSFSDMQPSLFTVAKTSWWKKSVAALTGAALATTGILSILGKVALTFVVVTAAVTPVGWSLIGLGALALIGAASAQIYDFYRSYKRHSQISHLASIAHETTQKTFVSTYHRLASEGIQSRRESVSSNTSVVADPQKEAPSVTRDIRIEDAPGDEVRPSSPRSR